MKKNLLFACIIFLGLLSSCGVYSLYPIFTPETLVKKDEVIGKWTSLDSDKDYITFSAVRYSIGQGSAAQNRERVSSDLKISFSSEDGTVVDTGEYVIENGDTTIRKDTIVSQLNDLVKLKLDKLGDFKIPSNNKKDDY
ncbi:MAG: hypothetical protein AAFO69_04310, partial [Bacteroidota bacterium]